MYACTCVHTYGSSVWMYTCAVAYVEVREQLWEFSFLLLPSLSCRTELRLLGLMAPSHLASPRLKFYLPTESTF